MLLAILYFTISFLGAFLLFGVQPMIAKFLTPTLGGTPIVWNICMVFFQTLLLLGYLYAHFSVKALGTRRQAVVHVFVLALSLLAFPVGLVLDVTTIDPFLHPVLWQLHALTISVGAPFFLLSATSPLIQSWFAKTGHRLAKNPYILFASSNLGSLLGLLGYPFIIEPAYGLQVQATLLQYGIAAQAALMALAAATLWRYAPAVAAQSTIAERAPPLTRQQITSWVIMAAIPSSILYGVTSYIISDIAAVSLMWVIPLALYLVTFIILFLIPRDISRYLTIPHGIAAVAVMAMMEDRTFDETTRLICSLVGGFVIMMSCHSRLVRLKPGDHRQLTAYYCWMAAGGILGGAFNSLLAPVLFKSIVEYPLAVILSLAVIVPWKRINDIAWKDIATRKAVFGALFIVLLLLAVFYELYIIELNIHAFTIYQIVLVLLILNALFCAALITQYLRHSAILAFVLACLFHCYNVGYAIKRGGFILFKDRNYYSMHIVYQFNDTIMYTHGTTIHGLQSSDEAKKLQVTAYYSPSLKEIKAAIRPDAVSAPIGLIGLGIGSSLCVASPGQDIDVYEIDETVVYIARDTGIFSYYSDCPGRHNLIMGDARLKFANAADQRYGMMIMDAFTSDAIPVHLITREAVTLYKQKMRTNGVIVFNISNRNMDIAPILAAVANANGLLAYVKNFEKPPHDDLLFPSRWVIMTEDPTMGSRLKDWQPLPAPDRRYLWTDDYSNIANVLYIFQ